MDFRDVVRRRQMVRSYTDAPVDPATVDRMLEHAVHAPSAGFSQGWAFLRLDSSDDVDRFWRATAPRGAAEQPSRWLEGMRRAPVLIVPMSRKDAYLDRYAEADKGWADRDESRWPIPYWHVDTGMAALLILQTAVDERLGACFFGIPAERVEAFRAAFGVPADHTPIGAITVGHPAPDRKSPSLTRRRRTPDEVVHRGRW
ncbi:MAG TPA: nitroreductase family protein [Nocardioidaceae bacterium]|nr:nitroreductase family protein [Nocardioidaceae bacterium]